MGQIPASEQSRQHPRYGEKQTVLLFGEALADVFPDRTVLGGAPFNVANHLQAFGQRPVLLTCLGDDALGDEIFQVMTDSGMETQAVQRTGQYPTGRVEVHIAGRDHLFEIFPAQAYDHIDAEIAMKSTASVDARVLYFGTLAQREEPSRRALQSLLADFSGIKFLDINLRSPWYDEVILHQSLVLADMLKLNVDELAVLAKIYGIAGMEQERQLEVLATRFALARIILTRGSEGAWMYDRAGVLLKAETPPVMSAFVDTVGAGDGFCAVCLLGELCRWPNALILERANAFAAAICGCSGAIPTPHLYEKMKAAWDV